MNEWDRHGAQGILDTASQATLTNEFGTTKEEDVIIQILEKGEMQESEVSLIAYSSFSPWGEERGDFLLTCVNEIL